MAGQNEERACVVERDEAITATSDVRGRREPRTGRYVVPGAVLSAAEADVSGEHPESGAAVRIEALGLSLAGLGVETVALVGR